MLNIFQQLVGVRSVIIFALALSAMPSVAAQSIESYERCPTISVECPNENVSGKPLVFRAIVGVGEDAKLSFKWDVDGNGAIVAGQGTREITVEGDARKTIVATLHVGGLEPTCPSTASCSIVICGAPVAYLFDKYGWTPTEASVHTKPCKANKRRPNRTIKPR